MSQEYMDLLDAAIPSPFGIGNETKYDESIRKAMHIPAERIVGISYIRMPSILEKFKQVLFPEEENIYLKVSIMYFILLLNLTEIM
jgi:hypothetical protein